MMTHDSTQKKTFDRSIPRHAMMTRTADTTQLAVTHTINTTRSSFRASCIPIVMLALLAQNCGDYRPDLIFSGLLGIYWNSYYVTRVLNLWANQ